jgi:hypothetical protein
MDKRRREIDSVVRRMPADDRERIVTALDMFSHAADGSDLGNDAVPGVPSIVPIPHARA